MSRPTYLTKPEVAAIAKTSPKSVEKWLADGRLTHYRPGRRVLVREDDLLAFLEGRPQPSRTEERR